MFKPNYLHSLIVAAVLAPAVVSAAGVETYISAPYHVFDGDLVLDNALGLSVSAGYRFDNPFGIEAYYSQANTQTDDPTKTDVDYKAFGLSGLYHFAESSQLSPYILLGLSNAKVEGARTISDESIDGALGLKYHVTEMFDIRAEVRDSHFIDESYDNVSVGLGFGLRFGGEKAAAPAPVAPPAPAAPMDSDKDGVFDNMDKCPGTAPKLKVDADGCPIILKETVAITVNVLFDTASDLVKPEFDGEVKRVADFLEQYEGTKVVIEGHTDTRGSNAMNKTLSQKRADSVAKVLVSKFGIDAARVKAVGFGEEQPLITNDKSPQDQAKNRRVVAKVSAEKQTQVTK